MTLLAQHRRELPTARFTQRSNADDQSAAEPARQAGGVAQLGWPANGGDQRDAPPGLAAIEDDGQVVAGGRRQMLNVLDDKQVAPGGLAEDLSALDGRLHEIAPQFSGGDRLSSPRWLNVSDLCNQCGSEMRLAGSRRTVNEQEGDVGPGRGGRGEPLDSLAGGAVLRQRDEPAVHGDSL